MKEHTIGFLSENFLQRACQLTDIFRISLKYVVSSFETWKEKKQEGDRG